MAQITADPTPVGTVRTAGTTIDYLGHAGFVASHGGVRVLVDPWFHPAFLESWFPLPDNRHLLAGVVAGRYDALYVSHTHTDHLDERLLAQLPKDLPVLCARFRSGDLRRRLEGIGFTELVLLDHGESVDLGGGVTATVLLDTSHKEDSALLLDLGGFRFLDLNDCHPRLGDLPQDVDLLAAQFSGAMWYPNCYDYPEATMGAKVAEVRAGLLHTLVSTVRATGARHYLPSAGPAAFLDPDLRPHNDPDTTIFPRWEQVSADFAAAEPQVPVVRVCPGDRVEVVDGRPVAVGVNGSRARGSSGVEHRDDLDAYAERRAAEWGAHRDRPATPVSTAELETYVRELVGRNRRLLRGYERDLAIATGDGGWTVGIRPTAEATHVVEGLPDEDAPSIYRFDVPTRVLRSIVDGDATWEEALLSMRIRLRRDPDVFDVTLMGLLRYGETPATTAQLLKDRAGSDETIERDGVRMPRWCPHAGEDLTLATVSDGVIECPRHHWAWDLATGQCVRGGDLPLAVTPVAVTPAVLAPAVDDVALREAAG